MNEADAVGADCTVGASTRIEGEIPLAETFGYMTTLRSLTWRQNSSLGQD